MGQALNNHLKFTRLWLSAAALAIPMAAQAEDDAAIPDGAEESATETAAEPTMTEAQLPDSIRAEMLADPLWAEMGCDADTPDRARVYAFDANADGEPELVVWSPCFFGANDGRVDVFMLRDGDYVSVLNFHGEVLAPTAVVTNGFHEFQGGICDGLFDCQTSSWRWNGTHYQNYQTVQDPVAGE